MAISDSWWERPNRYPRGAPRNALANRKYGLLSDFILVEYESERRHTGNHSKIAAGATESVADKRNGTQAVKTIIMSQDLGMALHGNGRLLRAQNATRLQGGAVPLRKRVKNPETFQTNTAIFRICRHQILIIFPGQNFLKLYRPYTEVNILTPRKLEKRSRTAWSSPYGSKTERKLQIRIII